MARIEITGNVGRQPELKYTNDGSAYLSFSVADSKSRKLDNGEWEKLKEQWFSVTIWRDLAEFYADKIQQGQRLTVWGEFFERKYESDKGPGVSLDVEAKGLDIWRTRSNGTQKPTQAQNAPAQDPWGQPTSTSAPF